MKRCRPILMSSCDGTVMHGSSVCKRVCMYMCIHVCVHACMYVSYVCIHLCVETLNRQPFK